MEALPIGLSVGISLIPFGVAFLLTRFPFPRRALLPLVGQFIIAVGAGTVPLSVIARGMRPAGG